MSILVTVAKQIETYEVNFFGIINGLLTPVVTHFLMLKNHI